MAWDEWILPAAAALALLLLLALLAALALCRRQMRALRRDMDALAKRLTGQTDDIAGLCSAALRVDQRLAHNEKRLAELFDWAESQKTHETFNQPYHSAIDLIRRGSDATELVSQCGISREEAALLLRLHSAEPPPGPAA